MVTSGQPWEWDEQPWRGPHVIGHRSRLVALRELVEHIAGHDGVWFGSHADVADWVMAHG
jgi:hypothetical protein